MKRLVLFCMALMLTQAALAGEGGYLFVTFKGEMPMGEQIYFALSRDGRNWEALNQSNPVLVSSVGEQGVRDPYILRDHEGEGFILIATDLCINRNGNWHRASRAGSKCLVVWRSPDLVHWTAPDLVKVSADDAGCTWAPEAVYDEENSDYLVFWASTNDRFDFKGHRIWAARTKNFKTFSEPFIYLQKDKAVIDTTIVRDGDQYYRFTKDETRSAITMDTSKHLMEGWKEIESFSLRDLQGYEGPECYRIPSNDPAQPAEWRLVIDNYARGRGYQTYVTTDLASGDFKETPNAHYPFRFRHGSILTLDEKEYQTLETAYGAPKPETK